jgi:serine/threonine-protein kinase HipA
MPAASQTATSCTLQLHAHGAWHDVGSASLFGNPAQGWHATTYTGYDVAWAVEHAGARDAHAFSCRWPVGLEPVELAHWPVFLIDMLPQGFGRAELLRRLALPETAAEPADWPLLLAGAGNPIGNLRIKEAAAWLAQHGGAAGLASAAQAAGSASTGLRGFSDEEVAQRGDDFSEYLAAHGLFVAGSSGVQGEWPKLLLTRADDGLLYLDHTLPDARAREHFIVKFGRGANARLEEILQHEAAYMALAQHLSLRVHAPLRLQGRALFIPRFDRRSHVANGVASVERLAQESIASLTGKAGFGMVPSHNEVCAQLLARCTDGPTELLEYLRRDVANLALGNKDNHARNTAVQRDFAGQVRLTPLFDFAPMYLHPDGIARRIRWEGNDAGSPDWPRVLDALCAPNVARQPLVQGLQAMVPALEDIAANGVALGLAAAVHQHLRPGIEQLAKALAALR